MEKVALTPLISVIMPVYNTEAYLKESIESILNQTIQDFEFLIFDDASTDKGLAIIQEYAAKDNRIKLFSYKVNSGYLVHLNTGLELAKGEYIARMDSDDISLPERFEKQIDYFEKNPKIDLVGGWVKYFSGDKVYENDFSLQLPQFHEEIAAQLLLSSAFAHPLVMFKRKLVDLGIYKYDEKYYPAEDYDLWSKIVLEVKVANIQDYILKYRLHDSQISHKKNIEQRLSSLEIRNKYVKESIGLNENDLIWHSKTWFSEIEKSKDSEFLVNVFNDFEIIERGIENKISKAHFAKNIRFLTYYHSIFHPSLMGWYKRSVFNVYSPFKSSEILLLKLRQFKWVLKSMLNFG